MLFSGSNSHLMYISPLPPTHIFQLCAEFNRVASKNLEGDFFEALDQLIPRSLQLFKDRKCGAVGHKLTELMQDINFVVRNFM